MKLPFKGIFLLVLLVGCATPVTKTDPVQDNLKLIATDLVSAMIQIRELNPTTTTLQLSPPRTEFGSVLETAFERAGYGIQRVDADQGSHYLSYAVRSSETEAGVVNDYLIRVQGIEIRREYNTTDSGVYPSSLMFIRGTDADLNIKLSDEIFAEQGGEESYLSGVEGAQQSSLDVADIREIVSDSDTGIVVGRRTAQAQALARAKEQLYEAERSFEQSDLETMSRYKRLVILFEDNTTLELGPVNKTAIRTMSTDYRNGDVFEVTACDDFDGQNEMAERRAVRIKEEFMGLGIPSEAVFRAPCVRANFRHQSDNSPVPAAIVLYRKTAGGRLEQSRLSDGG
ncbi:MAG: hypothetical protein KTR33_12615 [Gammaproteobacteria bacterium]|nr:hypothetical protein [Gammaproteobacteria bacterium]